MPEASGHSDLAETEYDAIAEVPTTVRIGTVGTEPTAAISVTPDVEHKRVTNRVGNAFHRDPEDFATRLVAYCSRRCGPTSAGQSSRT